MSEQIASDTTRAQRFVRRCKAPFYRFIAGFNDMTSDTPTDEEAEPATVPAVTTLSNPEPAVPSYCDPATRFTEMARIPDAHTRPMQPEKPRLTVLGGSNKTQLNRAFGRDEDILGPDAAAKDIPVIKLTEPEPPPSAA